MNGHLHVPRLEATVGRVPRVSDFFRPGEEPPVASAYVPSQTSYQETDFLFSAPRVLIDLNQWTPLGTDIDSGPHGLFSPREGAWSYITPSAWVPEHSALRLPQYARLNWNAQTYDTVPGDRPDVDDLQVAVRAIYGLVQAWLQSHRAGRTIAVISVDTGILVPPQPPVENDPGLGIHPVEPESTNLVRDGSIAVIRDDISAEFLGTNAFVVSVGVTSGAPLGPPIASASALVPPAGDRLASYKMLVYGDPRNPDQTQIIFDENVSFLESLDWGHESEYGGLPEGIAFDDLKANLAAFFHFDPETGIDLPLD